MEQRPRVALRRLVRPHLLGIGHLAAGTALAGAGMGTSGIANDITVPDDPPGAFFHGAQGTAVDLRLERLCARVD
jgi:hypothetical protein